MRGTNKGSFGATLEELQPQNCKIAYLQVGFLLFETNVDTIRDGKAINDLTCGHDRGQ